MRNRFPLYIVSKGRADTRLTAKSLEGMGLDYFIVVEPDEVEAYAAVIDREKVLALDMDYKRNYDTFDDLGDTKGKGPGAARNFVWAHSISQGHSWHWVMDDNINGFYRLNYNLKTPCVSGGFWRAMEEFCLRYSNVGMAGPNYFMFASRKAKMPPFTTNTRIYSCNLIRNDIGLRWRGRYNEDTDLSIRMMKDGWCTVQFNAFLQCKTTTQALKGGNTEMFYDKEGTKPKSQMQVDMHPEISTLVWKFNRWHHEVDYGVFRHLKLKRRPDTVLKEGTDNFGMVLQDRIKNKWVTRIDGWKPKGE